MKMMHDIIVFNRCAKLQSFTKAAVSLGISPSAVGKIIQKIESLYGIKLFYRHTRAIELTEHGEILLLHSERIIDELEAVQDKYSLLDQQVSGRLKISMPNLDMIFSDVLARFIDSYSDVKLDVSFTDQYVDLIAEKYDLVIRVGELKDSEFIAKKIGQFKMCVVHAPTYYFDADHLYRHRYLLYKYPNTGQLERWPSYLDVIDIQNSVVLNSISSIKSLCLSGAGIAYLPEPAIQKEINSGLLMVIDVGDFEYKDIHVLWAKNKKMSLKQRTFIDFLSDFFD